MGPTFPGSLCLEGKGVHNGLLKECLNIEFSPQTRFTKLQLKYADPALDAWDVIVVRPNGIHILDVLEEIFKA
ncbi:hypothetical protein DXG01_007658 [Tephrocybe rancida]|nr:hypothetical protein DXG01_007658 [Tephrocybe rancida]